MNGGVAPDVPGITSATRQPKKDNESDDINNTPTTKFINTINKFKEDFWTEFIKSKQSQNPNIIDEYIRLLDYMYRCLVHNKNCKNIPYKSFNANNSTLSTLMTTIDSIESEYWLKRTLVQFPFTFTKEKILDSN